MNIKIHARLHSLIVRCGLIRNNKAAFHRRINGQFTCGSDLAFVSNPYFLLIEFWKFVKLGTLEENIVFLVQPTLERALVKFVVVLGEPSPLSLRLIPQHKP